MIPYLHFLYLQLGSIKIYTWGFFVSLGFLITLAILVRQYPKEKNMFIDLALYIIIGAIIGSRLFYVAIYAPDTLEAFKNIFKIWEGGMASFGGILGGASAMLLYLRKKKLNLYEYAQKIAFILPLGLAIGRIGCFLVNDHPGIKTIAMPFSLAYPDGARFDLGYLLMLFNAFLFMYFLILRKRSLDSARDNFSQEGARSLDFARDNFSQEGKRKISYPQVKQLYLENFLLIYGIGRFLLDFLRIDEPKIAGLIPSQYGSMLLVALGSYLIIKTKKRNI
ncbi:prolipoprotein diacylglyceryl transferase [Patescibacteria group bacterium]|nr:prolipoprotein diacylglyceryl transferase [Patescibacteria group bacterium]